MVTFSLILLADFGFNWCILFLTALEFMVTTKEKKFPKEFKYNRTFFVHTIDYKQKKIHEESARSEQEKLRTKRSKK